MDSVLASIIIEKFDGSILTVDKLKAKIYKSSYWWIDGSAVPVILKVMRDYNENNIFLKDVTYDKEPLIILKEYNENSIYEYFLTNEKRPMMFPNCGLITLSQIIIKDDDKEIKESELITINGDPINNKCKWIIDDINKFKSIKDKLEKKYGKLKIEKITAMPNNCKVILVKS